MSARTYWKLLITFGVLCQGIIGTFSEKDNDESSELLLRQKSLINRNPGGDVREMLRNVPYIVQVKESYSEGSCVGVILSTHVVLTLAKCVILDRNAYRVYSGSAQKLTSNSNLVRHTISEKIIFGSNNPHKPEEDIALISVAPPFIFSPKTRSIKLHEGEISPTSYATVTGWGCHVNGEPGTAHADYLRSITVPIISNRDCAILHTDSFTVLDSHICTLDSTGNQYCSADDEGAPLVIAENNELKLVGIHFSSGGGVEDWIHPDVFVNLQYPRYKAWIAQNILILNRN